MPTLDLAKYISTSEAAQYLGVTTDHIGHLLRAGDLKGTKFGYSWLVLKSSLEEYRKNRPKPGRKTK